MLQTSDIDHLGAQGALPDLVQEWKKSGLWNNARIQDLNKPAQTPIKALTAAQANIATVEAITREISENEPL
jgi:hypothetical protein